MQLECSYLIKFELKVIVQNWRKIYFMKIKFQIDTNAISNELKNIKIFHIYCLISSLQATIVQNSGGLGISSFDFEGLGCLRSAGRVVLSAVSISSEFDPKSKGFLPKKRPNDLPNDSETC